MNILPACHAENAYLGGAVDIAWLGVHPGDAPVREIYAVTRRGTPATPAAAFLPYLDAAADALMPGASAPGS